MKAKDFLKQPIPEPNYIKRVSKELARFTSAIETMSKEQAKDVIMMFQLVLKAVESKGTDKPVVYPPIMEPVQVDIADTRPLPTGLKVTKRNNEHLIDEVEFVYNENK